jgi:hypothetical protein
MCSATRSPGKPARPPPCALLPQVAGGAAARSNSRQQPTSPHNQQQQPQPQQAQLPQSQQQGQQQQQPQPQPQHPGMHKQLPPPVQQGQAPMQPPPVPLQQQVAQQQLTHLFPRPGNGASMPAAVPQLPLDAAGRMVPPLQVCNPARRCPRKHRWWWLHFTAGLPNCCVLHARDARPYGHPLQSSARCDVEAHVCTCADSGGAAGSLSACVPAGPRQGRPAGCPA